MILARRKISIVDLDFSLSTVAVEAFVNNVGQEGLVALSGQTGAVNGEVLNLFVRRAPVFDPHSASHIG